VIYHYTPNIAHKDLSIILVLKQLASESLAFKQAIDKDTIKPCTKKNRHNTIQPTAALTQIVYQQPVFQEIIRPNTWT
jgi:hypothetical protein